MRYAVLLIAMGFASQAYGQTTYHEPYLQFPPEIVPQSTMNEPESNTFKLFPDVWNVPVPSMVPLGRLPCETRGFQDIDTIQLDSAKNDPTPAAQLLLFIPSTDFCWSHDVVRGNRPIIRSVLPAGIERPGETPLNAILGGIDF